jgi:hypothetical protein
VTGTQAAGQAREVLGTAVAGMLSLGVAVGLGRFAFTPLLPMMLDDGSVSLATASWLANANYIGYLLGALLCTLQPWLWSRVTGLPAVSFASIVRGGLAATAVLTIAMALPWPGAWPTLRFAAGVASALVLVFTAGWCLARLSRLGAPAMGAVIFVGPGAGIVISGLCGGALVAGQWSSASGWLILGVLAAVLTACVWSAFRGGEERLVPMTRSTGSLPPRSSAAVGGTGGGRGEAVLLAVNYGLAGFGYIITATFLPVIAREAIPGSAWLDLFWPLFGCGAVAGALLATRIPPAIDRRYLLAGAYAFQALGAAASLWSPTSAGFAIGSLMLGLPFTVITFFAMQEARRLRASAAASFMGLLTATYGIGQVAGPSLVAALLPGSSTPGAGLTLSLQIAAAALATGALAYLVMVLAWPVAPGREARER